jgi:hypothetical protein
MVRRKIWNHERQLPAKEEVPGIAIDALLADIAVYCRVGNISTGGDRDNGDFSTLGSLVVVPRRAIDEH